MLWIRYRTYLIQLSWLPIQCDIKKGSGYEKKSPKTCEIRLERNYYWMKFLRTSFTYGMNKRTRNNEKWNYTSVRKSFLPIYRSINNSNRSRENTGNFQKLCSLNFLETIENIVQNNLVFYKNRTLFNHSKKKILNKIASDIPNILHDNSGYIHLNHLHSFMDPKLCFQINN